MLLLLSPSTGSSQSKGSTSKELVRMDNVPSAANDRETRWPHGAGCSPARADLDGLRHGAAGSMEEDRKQRGIRGMPGAGAGI